MPKIRGVKPDYWTDDDVVELSIAARLLFIGIWNYSCDNGHIQDKSRQIKMRIMPADDVNVAELLREIEARGLIERADGWITTPNLTHHQKPHKSWWATCSKPGCEPPEGATRAPGNRGTTVAQPGSTVEQPVSNRGATADVDVDVDVELKVSREEHPTADAVAPMSSIRDDVARICDHLADRIEANGSMRPAIGKSWQTSARLMLDKDNRDESDVHAAIEWSQNHDFWRGVVLSMPKLRQKYDTLRLQATRKGDMAAPTMSKAEQRMQANLAVVEELRAEEQRSHLRAIEGNR